MSLTALFGRIPDRWRDVLLVALVMFITLGAVEGGFEEGATANVIGYAVAVVSPVTLLLWRRSPLIPLFATAGLTFIYHATGNPGGPPHVPFYAALFLASLQGYFLIALATGIFVSGIGVSWRYFVEGEDPFFIGIEPAMVIAAAALGAAARARRLWAEEVQARLERAEAEKELEALRRVDAERIRIAQELHDVLAHTLAVVNVQAGVASDLFDEDPASARAALEDLRVASRDAMQELRATVGVLRESQPAPRTPAPGVTDLDRIADVVRQAGIEMDTRVEGSPRPLPPAVELATYRIVQESLTNVIKHAAASRASVRLDYEPAGIRVHIVDDGQGPIGEAAASNGFGLRGMRERVEALGGQFDAGLCHDGGFQVHAWLPVTAQ